MAAQDEGSDFESDWTFVDRGTIESVETRQGSVVFYSKRTTSQSSDGASDVAMATAEGSRSEAEFEVLAHFAARTPPDSNSEDVKSEISFSVDVNDCTEQDNLAAENVDLASASSDVSSEIPHCVDDGIMIISNHFSPSLEENHENVQGSLIMSSSFHGWQELPQLTESSTAYSLSDELSISDDETGIVTISDEVEDQGIDFVHLGEHQGPGEEGSMSEHSDSSSFLFDSDLFDVSEDLEVLDLSDSLRVDTVNHPEHQNYDENKANVSDGDDSSSDDEGEEEERELSTLITVDAPTLVFLLCLTTALGFSIGHGLNVHLSSSAAGNSSQLTRPGPDTASVQNQQPGLKFPEDNVNEEQVYLWKEKEASIALMFDLKELHSKLQKEHFNILKAYDNLKSRLHVSKVMGWYWRWKFEHDKVENENLTWNRALKKQVERLQVLYTHEKRLADLWRDGKKKEAKDKLRHKYWKTLHHRWAKSSDPIYKLEKSTANPEVGVCNSKFPADFKRRWTQDARATGHAQHRYRIAISNGQETRVFKWDQTMMKSVRETGDPADNESPLNLLVIDHPGSLVKDIILNPNRKKQREGFPLFLRLVLEDGSVKDISSNLDNSKEDDRPPMDGERTQTGKNANTGKQSGHSAPPYKADTSEHVLLGAGMYPAAKSGRARDSRRLNLRAILLTKNKTDTSNTEKKGDRTCKPKQRRVRKPCFEKPAKSSEEKGQLELKKEEEFLVVNETIPDIHGDMGMMVKEVKRKGRLAREEKIRNEKLARRQLKQRGTDLRRHVTKAGKILQALYSERRRITRHKVQLRHERRSMEKAKTKLDGQRKQHEQNTNDVETLIVELKTEKERLQKWRKKEEKRFKQFLAVEIRKLERDRQKFEREKEIELRHIKTKLVTEKRKLKSDYKELRSLKKAVRKEYKKWLRELRKVHKNDKKSRGENKPDKGVKKDKTGHEYEGNKRKERDKKKSNNKGKTLEDIKYEKERRHGPKFVQNTTPSKTKRNKEKTKKYVVGDKSKHSVENNKRRERAIVSDNEQRELTQEGQHFDYRKQLEKLRQWVLQIEEQKLDQEQLQKDHKKTFRNVEKHLKKAEQWSNKLKKTAVQPEKSKAMAAFADFALSFGVSSEKAHETLVKHNGTIRRNKVSRKPDSTEDLGTVAGKKDLYTRYAPATAFEPIPPAKSRFKSDTKRGEREASEHNESKPKCPDVNRNPIDGGLGSNGPFPPDKLRAEHKRGGDVNLEQGQQFDEHFRNRWVNYAIKQESCYSRNPKPPDGLRVQPEPPGQREDESWYMRRAKERESMRKSSSYNARKHKPNSWMFERASNRAEQRSNWEPWYERRAKGRDEWRAGHQDTWFLERGYYRKIRRYLSDWRENLGSSGPTKRRGYWGT